MEAVRFIRVHGRVIAIRAAQVGIGAAVGAAYGAAIGTASLGDTRTKLRKVMATNTVDTKKFVAKTGIKNVTVITSKAELYKQKNLSPMQKRLMLGSVIAAEKGNNAAAGNLGGKDFLIASKRVNASVIGHELGHTIDRRQVGVVPYNKKYSRLITGGKLELEKRAWELSPVKSQAGREDALKTYSRVQNAARVGLVTGAAAAFFIGRHLK